MKPAQFTVHIEQDEDGMFIGSIPAVPSCHAEGKTTRLLYWRHNTRQKQGITLK